MQARFPPAWLTEKYASPVLAPFFNFLKQTKTPRFGHESPTGKPAPGIPACTDNRALQIHASPVPGFNPTMEDLFASTLCGHFS
jgi:hypothetical protein